MDTIHIYKTVEAGGGGGNTYVHTRAKTLPKSEHLHGTVRSGKRPFARARHDAARIATICTAQCGPQGDYLRDTMRSAERPFARHSAFRRETICTAQCVPQCDHLHGSMRSGKWSYARYNAISRTTVGTAKCDRLGGTAQCAQRSDRFHGRGRWKFDREKRPFSRRSAVRSQTRKPSLL